MGKNRGLLRTDANRVPPSLAFDSTMTSAFPMHRPRDDAFAGDTAFRVSLVLIHFSIVVRDPLLRIVVFSLITGSAPLAPKVRCHRGHAKSVFKALGSKCRPAEQELHRARIQMDRLRLGRVLGPQAGMTNRPCISAFAEARRPVSVI